jgi:hypothetical protein
VSPSFSCSITKSLISSNKWVANANLSPIFKSPWTCRPSWLTCFHWMKHNSNTCMSKYNVLLVNSALQPLFIEPPRFFLESHVPRWLVLDGIIFPLMSNFFGARLWFCAISFTTFVRSVRPYWHWYLQTTSQLILHYLWTYIALQNKQLVTYFMFTE